ncbi:MAG: glycosyltransferase family 39 protein [Elusimicrobiota bacterium]|nr:glycosyltransferase family 39 protein [Elusimicrobiota bacterium]
MSEISEDHSNLSPWRKKFLANRMTFESILFEKELVVPKREKFLKGLLVLLGIWLFHALLLAQWAVRRGYFFNQADAESFGGVLRYAAYLKSQGFWALVKPEFSDLTLNPPLYYLSYVPVFDYLTKDLNLALIIVNSFFLLVLALAIFLAVCRSRPHSAGWFGAAFALAFPCVLETARRPSPDLALMAMVAALYACYIRSDDFEHPKWSLAFSVCMGLGFFSHRFFWLYALPLVPFIISGLANPFGRDEMLKGLFPSAIVNLPWYVFTLAAVAAGLVPLWGDYHGFWHYFKLGASSAGLPLFVIGSLALTWMYYSVFMPYDKKKIVAAWFWTPYLLLTWLVRGSHPQLLYPALLTFAVAVPVMTPRQARNYLLVFVLALGALNQSGLVRPFPEGSKYPWAGLPLPPAGDYRSAELMALVETNTPAEGGLAGIYGDASLNAGALRFAASKTAGPVKFADSPACPGCAFLLIHKTPRFGETPSKVEENFAALRAEPWFPALFQKKAELELADSSKAEVYLKTPSTTRFLKEGAHEVRNLSLGPLKIEEATLKLSGFDPATGAYASAELFAPAAELLGGDVYGLTLDIQGLSAASASLDPFVPAGIAGMKVSSAKITEYAVERYLVDRCPFLSDIKVSLNGSLAVSALARGGRLEALFALAVKDGGVLEAKPVSFKLGWVELESHLLNLFTFRLDFSDNPYGLKISRLRINKKMLELY